MFHDLVKKVTAEIGFVLDTVSEKQVTELVHGILNANKIVVYGAGRVGMACKGFSMRLGHLGRTSFTLGDSTVPSIGKGDLLLLSSGSGETQTVYDIAGLGKKNGARVTLITSRPDSTIGKLADSIVTLKAPTKIGPIEGLKSIQPMATLYEQCLQVFFDTVVLLLMEETRQDHDDLWARHSNLE